MRKAAFLFLSMLLLGIGCSKKDISLIKPEREMESLPPAMTDGGCDENLRESLSISMPDYNDLDFDKAIIHNVEFLDLFVYQIPFTNKPKETDFVLAAIDKDGVFLKGVIVNLDKTNEGDETTFDGFVTYSSLDRSQEDIIELENGMNNDQSSSYEVYSKSFVVPSENWLPDVIVTAVIPPSGGSPTYSEWINFLGALGFTGLGSGGGGTSGFGNGSTGYYGWIGTGNGFPGSSGGGSGGGPGGDDDYSCNGNPIYPILSFGGDSPSPIEIFPDAAFFDNYVDDPNYFEDDLTPITFDYDQDPWATISNVIPTSKFVGYETNSNCLDLAKRQIARSGLTDLGYSSAYKIFDAQGGPYPSVAKDGVEYIVTKLQAGKPVMVGVDYQAGPSPGNPDNKTDHFVVIVGMGSDSNGNYFTFFDSGSSFPSKGASSSNKLYYDSITGEIKGQTACTYSDGTALPQYTVTQIRKNK